MWDSCGRCRSPGRMGGKGTRGCPCGSGMGGQPGAPVLLPASTFSLSWLVCWLLTHTTQHTRASATATFTLRKSRRGVTLSWDLGRRKQVMLELQ